MPAVIVPGGGVIEGGEPAARMQAEVAAIALEAGIALLGPNCMGVIDLHAPSATYIDDLPASLRRGGTAAIAQSGSVANAFVNAGPRIGWSRIISCGSEVVLDVCDYLAACLDDPVTDSVVLFVEGFKRPERFLALADRALAMDVPVLAVKVGRSPQAQAAADLALGFAGRRHARHRGGAPRGGRGAVRRPRCAARGGGARQRVAAARPAGGAGADRPRHRLDRRGIAHRRPRAGDRAGPAARSRPDARARIAAAMPTLTHLENPIDPWGAGEAAPTYRATLDALADSGAYDVVGLVHDFPYGSRRERDGARARARRGARCRDRGTEPACCPSFVSLTSGDVPPEIVDAMDAAGGVPILRGIASGLGAIAKVAWWERRHADRLRRGPARAGWPAIAAHTPPYGLDRPASRARGIGPARAASSRSVSRSSCCAARGSR